MEDECRAYYCKFERSIINFKGQLNSKWRASLIPCLHFHVALHFKRTVLTGEVDGSLAHPLVARKERVLSNTPTCCHSATML
jgi:hypothetical protein